MPCKFIYKWKANICKQKGSRTCKVKCCKVQETPVVHSFIDFTKEQLTSKIVAAQERKAIEALVGKIENI